MFKKPQSLFGTIAAVAALLLILSIALGSSGETDGVTSGGQKVANVTYPLFFLTLAVGIILGVVYLLRRGRDRGQR